MIAYALAVLRARFREDPYALVLLDDLELQLGALADGVADRGRTFVWLEVAS